MVYGPGAYVDGPPPLPPPPHRIAAGTIPPELQELFGIEDDDAPRRRPQLALVGAAMLASFGVGAALSLLLG